MSALLYFENILKPLTGFLDSDEFFFELFEWFSTLNADWTR